MTMTMTTTAIPGDNVGGMTGGGSGGSSNSNSTPQLFLPQDLKGLQFIFDWGYPKDDVEISAGKFIDLLSTTIDNNGVTVTKGIVNGRNPTTTTGGGGGGGATTGIYPSTTGLGSSFVPNEFEADCDGLATAAITAPNQESFISQRIAKSGEYAGPEALFSRFNCSIMMTRSIGDLYGPRSCVCIPEVGE